MDASAEDAGVLSAHRVGAVEPDDLLYLANNLLNDEAGHMSLIRSNGW